MKGRNFDVHASGPKRSPKNVHVTAKTGDDAPQQRQRVIDLIELHDVLNEQARQAEAGGPRYSGDSLDEIVAGGLKVIQKGGKMEQQVEPDGKH